MLREYSATPSSKQGMTATSGSNMQAAKISRHNLNGLADAAQRQQEQEEDEMSQQSMREMGEHIKEYRE